MDESRVPQQSVPDRDAADLFGVLSLACDAGIGLPAEHTLRVCHIACRLAAQMGLSATQQDDVYFTALLKDAGCTSWATQLATFIATDEIPARRDFLFSVDPSSKGQVLQWMLRYVGRELRPFDRALRVAGFMVHGRDFIREGYLSAAEVARRIAERLGLGIGVQEGVLGVCEQWNGAGMPRGLRGEAIPLAARIVFASVYAEVSHREGGRTAARRLLDERSGKAFDPAVVEAFMAAEQTSSFWPALEEDSAWETVLNSFPDQGNASSGPELLEAIALTFADFVDMKSHYLAGHSRRVAELAEAITARLGLPPAETASVRRAALMHDLGLVAVPSFILNQPMGELGQDARREVCTHVQYGAELTRRAVPLRGEAELIAAHHPELDDAAVGRPPMGASIIAVANRFDELTHDSAEGYAVTAEAALHMLREQAGDVFDPDVVQALSGTLGNGHASASPAPPAGLTTREVEVLRMAAAGLSRKEIAQGLVLAESTVRHHLESIYSKLGVSTRVAAVLRAMEYGLLL
ncbi:MAG: HD domain-containing phosphohydrolase [Dehalococcoidia bacterium]